MLKQIIENSLKQKWSMQKSPLARNKELYWTGYEDF